MPAGLHGDRSWRPHSLWPLCARSWRPNASWPPWRPLMETRPPLASCACSWRPGSRSWRPHSLWPPCARSWRPDASWPPWRPLMETQFQLASMQAAHGDRIPFGLPAPAPWRPGSRSGRLGPSRPPCVRSSWALQRRVGAYIEGGKGSPLRVRSCIRSGLCPLHIISHGPSSYLPRCHWAFAPSRSSLMPPSPPCFSACAALTSARRRQCWRRSAAAPSLTHLVLGEEGGITGRRPAQELPLVRGTPWVSHSLVASAL